MRISLITLTYGRVKHLQEAIESFQKQTHRDAEMFILNTCPQQKLNLTRELQDNFVNVINLPERPPCLGVARNKAIAPCTGEIICILDDDDIALPNYLAVYAAAFAANPGAQWVWVDSQFYLEAGKIKKISRGMCNTFAYTKEVWRQVGGYDAMNVGEDRQFIAKVTQAAPGVKVEATPEEIGYLYCWNNQVYHLSGLGDDAQQRLNSWDRARFDLEHKIKRGAVRTGDINLVPGWTQDYSKNVSEFLASLTPTPTEPNAVCLVELGRFGDIINILPVARIIAERWGKPVFMVAREFAGILDGVSYVIPHVVDFAYGELPRALDLAKKTYQHVINTQVWGVGFKSERLCKTYNLESWRLAGFLNEFSDRSRVPLFDLRDEAREAALFAKLSNGKPLLLTKLHGGITAPFRKAAEFEAAIRKEFEPEYQVIDLNSVQCKHIFDLLGLMDRAKALVSIDTMPLHLAAASGVPTIALINPTFWVGSIPRCNAVVAMTYTEVEANPEELCGLIFAATKKPRLVTEVGAQFDPPTRRVFHCVERHEGPKDPRKEFAWASWDALYKQGVIPCHYWKYDRDARNIGDKRALPYLKDVLEVAMKPAADHDIIMFTNDDNVLHPQLAEFLKVHVAIYRACTSHRCEFSSVRKMPDLTKPPSAFVKHASESHTGRDLIAGTKAWFVANWDNIPDFILGASDWDYAVACLIRCQFGIRSCRPNIEQVFFPAEIERGYVSHVTHLAAWTARDNERTSPSQLHNRRLFKEWGEKNMPWVNFTAHNQLGAFKV